MRFHNNALRPVRFGGALGFSREYKIIHLHKGVGFQNWIGANKTETDVQVNIFSTITSVTTLLVQLSGTDKVLDINSIGNYLVICTTQRMYTLLWIDGAYKNTEITTDIVFSVGITLYEETSVTANVDESNYETIGKSIFASIIAQTNKDSRDNKNTGAYSFRAAYRLKNGSYVMPSAPFIADYFNPLWKVKRKWLNNDGSNSEYQISWSRGTLKIELNNSNFSSLASAKDIIDGIVFFASKPFNRFDVEQMLEGRTDSEYGHYIIAKGLPESTTFFSQLTEEYVISSDWNSRKDPLGWFKVHEIPIDVVLDNLGGNYEEEINMSNFYQDYAARQSLPVDQFTHHRISSEQLFAYNSRIWLSGIKRDLKAPQMKLRGAQSTNLNTFLRVEITVATDIGDVVVSENYTGLLVFMNAQGVFKLYTPFAFYPDARAYKIEIFAWGSESPGAPVYKVLSASLTKSLSHNFSYLDYDIDTSSGFMQGQTIECKINPGTLFTGSFKSQSPEMLPLSTIKASELNNPLIYPAIHTYSIGTGKVKYLAAQSMPVSEGQFGEFPLFAFSDTGIYSMAIGTGDIIVTNVIPLSPLVADSKPVTGNGAIFMLSNKKIYMLSGRQIVEISQQITGDISPVPANDKGGRFALYSSHEQVCNLGDMLTTLTDFKRLADAPVLGFDHENSRLYASYPSLGFTYVFEMDPQPQWYRINQAFSQFVTRLPDTLGVVVSEDSNNYQLHYINRELKSGPVNVHFHTGVIDFGTNHRKKLMESIIHCILRSAQSYYLAFMVFASNDGINFTRISGNDRKTGHINDIQVTFMQASYKFFIFAFWGRLVLSSENYIETVEADAEPRYTHRRRSY